jgi:hypothetical protein
MRFTKIIIYNLSVFFALLFIVEAGFKVVAPGYEYYERTYAAKFEELAQFKLDTNWVKKDADLGWVSKQKTDLKFYRPDFFGVEYGIDGHGFRNPLTKGERVKKILLLGDSFLFGIFLENNQTISAKLQHELGSEYVVYNMAVPGWGLDQMSQAYAKYVDEINPDQVLLFFIDDDISRVMEALYWGAAAKQAYKLKNNQLVLRDSMDGKLNGLESFFVFNSQLVNRLYKIWIYRKAAPLAKAILNRMIQREQNYGRKLASVRFPRKEQIGNDHLKIYDLSTFFKDQNCYYLDMEKEIRVLPKEAYEAFYIPEDDHPSPLAAEFVANRLKKIITLMR